MWINLSINLVPEIDNNVFLSNKCGSRVGGFAQHLHDGGSQLEVGLVHLSALSHVDLQVVPAFWKKKVNQGELCCKNHLIKANKVVVKETLPSLSIGMFILEGSMPFLLKCFVGHKQLL